LSVGGIRVAFPIAAPPILHMYILTSLRLSPGRLRTVLAGGSCLGIKKVLVYERHSITCRVDSDMVVRLPI